MNTVVKTQYGEVRGSVADGVHTFNGNYHRTHSLSHRSFEGRSVSQFGQGSQESAGLLFGEPSDLRV
jgi:hypothetical protein